MLKVAAAIIEEDGKILIALRKRGDNSENKWEFPGGKIEPNETPEQCLERELFEEFGVKTKIGNFVCSSQIETSNLWIELIAYKVVHISGEFRLNVHQEIKWISTTELDNYDFAQADIPIVRILINRK